MMKFLFGLVIFQFLSQLSYAEWVKEMENPDLYQGDIVLDPDERNPDGSLNSASMIGGRWPNAEVPYVIHRSLLNEKEALQGIKDSIADYHKYTCIRFKPRTTESTYVNFYNGMGCKGPVGYKPGRVNSISIGKGCWKKGIIMHEMGHTLGFWHEQSRPDRDKYIKILWDNIMPGLSFNFDKHTTKEIDTLGTPYDLESMMHYGTASFSRNRKRTIQVIDYAKRLLIGQRRGFSNIDVKQLNLMYKCPVFRGTVPPKICKDQEGVDCKRFKRIRYCSVIVQETKMYDACCETCFGDELRGKRSHTYPPEHRKTTPIPGTCVDIQSKAKCKYWKQLGNCNSKSKALREFTRKNCCATCRGS